MNSDILAIVAENIAHDWKAFASTGLRMSEEEIQFVDNATDPSVPHEQCYEVLKRWIHEIPAAKAAIRLSQALVISKHQRLADIVLQFKTNGDNVDEVLAPHADREAKILEAMYLVADTSSDHWRELGKNLSITAAEAQRIERRFGPYRPRDKCMYVLYKWRQRTGLADFKISTLLQALHKTGLIALADQVNECAKGRPKQPGSGLKPTTSKEALVMITVGEITVENYMPSSSSTPGPHGSVPSTPRPKSVLSQDALRLYSLNKVFFHLLDLLQFQDTMRAEHPLTHFLRTKFEGAEIQRISRKDATICVSFPTSQICKVFKEMLVKDDLNHELCDCLVSALILKELGVQNLKLRATLT